MRSLNERSPNIGVGDPIFILMCCYTPLNGSIISCVLKRKCYNRYWNGFQHRVFKLVDVCDIFIVNEEPGNEFNAPCRVRTKILLLFYIIDSLRNS